MYLQNSALERTGLGTTRDQHLVINNFRPVTGVDSEVLRDELARLPQVKGVTQMGAAPWGDNINLNLLARSPEQGVTTRTAFQNTVGYDFFETMDIPLLAGRTFDRAHNDLPPQDNQNQAGPRQPINIVIDDVLASQLGFSAPAEAVDQTIYFPAGLDAQAQPYQVIGVVASRPLFLRGLGATSNIYNLGVPGMQNIIVRLAADDISGGVAGAEAVWRRLAPQGQFQRRFIDDMFNEAFERFARLSQVFVG